MDKAEQNLTKGQLEAFHAIARRAKTGDESAVPHIQKFLAIPSFSSQLGGDLADHAARTVLAKFCGTDLLRREATLRKMEELRGEVAGPSPSATEKLLAERIVVCWLHLHCLETEAANKGAADEEQSTFFQKSIDRAQKRYLNAIQALATVRKLALPVLQFNIARKQVNIAAGGAVAVPAEEPCRESADME